MSIFKQKTKSDEPTGKIAEILAWLAFVVAVIGWLIDSLRSFPPLPNADKKEDEPNK
jgi:hypothetical protein